MPGPQKFCDVTLAGGDQPAAEKHQLLLSAKNSLAPSNHPQLPAADNAGGRNVRYPNILFSTNPNPSKSKNKSGSTARLARTHTPPP